MEAAQTNNQRGSSRKNPTLESLFARDSVSENEKILSLISHCIIIFTCTDPSESPSQQELKRQNLIDLLSIIKASKKPLHDQVISPLMAMISANIFRPLPPPSKPSSSITADLDLFPDNEENPISKLSRMWSHLQLVYEILLRLVINTDTRKLGPYIDHPFLVSLLSLFQSEDPRELESLKNVYHRIYSRFTLHRSFMRKAMNDVFLNYVFETERHSGVRELLEIWGSIINGFTVPLKEEHKLFLMRVLIPLHKTKGMQGYHRQLAYCVSQFVHKEPVLGGVVVRGILKYWPVTNCQKEVLLIGELEELVEIIDTDQYRKLALPLCTQITRCFNSWNAQVAERALYVWNNEHFVKMASMAMEEVFPIVVEGMERNLKWHWSKSVRQLTENVKVMFIEMDQILYSKCLEEIKRRESTARQAEIKRKEKWDRIEMAAAKNHRFVQQKQPPYIFVSH
ncbi:Serine/threonine protein phosphatase 2A 57 kDa regulatory subunit B' alpha isoform [Morus notabilis]|uniref:Serine/threonine protein phosphatase 2A regulatory subunit n=1 Tax=Morus notabilis TaxID=981085 RepID=W9QBY9_9ROSA|nr:Serine/threonine protein phosphatase 2A 57 kDa regulatory subunit B' alpha isoform [Morus notabilis]